MITLGSKQICEYCLTENCGEPCRFCGYNKEKFKKEAGALAPGSVLSGRYIVGKLLGKGGFGITYLAYDIKQGKKVALKEYFPVAFSMRGEDGCTIVVSHSEDIDIFKTGMEKFYEEASLVATFNEEPNIVSVYEFFYENDTAYFVMELLRGSTLKSYIDDNGCLSPEQALFVANGVANALAAAHSKNVLHRDLTPDNIMLCDDGGVKLIDFGAARMVAADNPKSMSVILKQGFAPPEQYQRRGNQGPWTDLYSLGATLFYSVTNSFPNEPVARLDDDSDFQSNEFGIEPQLWEVIRHALNLKISDRYQSASEFLEAISKIAYQPQPIKLGNADSGSTQANEPEPVMAAAGAVQPSMPMANQAPMPTPEMNASGAVQGNIPMPGQAPMPTPEMNASGAVQGNIPMPGQAPMYAPAMNAQGMVQGNFQNPEVPVPQAAFPTGKKPRNKKLIAILCSVMGVVLAAGITVLAVTLSHSKKTDGMGANGYGQQTSSVPENSGQTPSLPNTPSSVPDTPSSVPDTSSSAPDTSSSVPDNPPTPPQNTTFSHGSWSGNTYTSDFLGIKIHNGTGWSVTSDAGLAALNGVPDMFESSLKEAFDKGLGVAEVSMSNNSSNASIMISVQDNNTSATPLNNEEDYFTYGIPQIQSQFEAMGFDSDVNRTSANFLGKSTGCIEVVTTVGDVSVYQYQLPVFKSHYIALVSLSASSKKELNDLLGMFTTLDGTAPSAPSAPSTPSEQSKPDGNTPTEVTLGGETYSTDITELDLRFEKLSNKEAESLKHFKNLKSLKLSYCTVSDLSALSSLTELETLELTGLHNISDLSFVTGMKKLKKLNANYMDLTDISPLKNLTALTDIDLSGNAINDLSPLHNCTGIKYLHLVGNKISDEKAFISSLEGLHMQKYGWISLYTLEGHEVTFAFATKADAVACKNKILKNSGISDFTFSTQWYENGELVEDFF